MAVLVFMLVACAAWAQSGTGAGVVEFLQGDVRINGSPAEFGQEVAVGDWVQTGPDAAVDIIFDGANVFRLGSNTVASLSIGADRQEVDLKFGSMGAVFERLRTLTGRGTFDVRTPTAVGGVRGTSFFMRVVDGRTTYVCTCNGTLELAPFGQNPFVESAAEHSAFYFRETEAGVVVERGDLVFHDNDSLNRLADKIDVTIPWGELPE
mgnify:CR=1 FL=1